MVWAVLGKQVSDPSQPCELCQLTGAPSVLYLTVSPGAPIPSQFVNRDSLHVDLDLPRLVSFVGVHDPSTQLLLNIIYAITGWIPAVVGARLSDIVGRRKLLLGVTIGMSSCLAIAAGTAANFVDSGSRPASVASITFIYLFGSIFALAFTSMQPIYPGEVLSNDMRAKGMGVFQLTSGCAGFVNTFAAPVALNNVRDTKLSINAGC